MITMFVQVVAVTLLPAALVFLILLLNDEPLMGKHVNTRWENIMNWSIVTVVVVMSTLLASAPFSLNCLSKDGGSTMIMKENGMKESKPQNGYQFINMSELIKKPVCIDKTENRIWKINRSGAFSLGALSGSCRDIYRAWLGKADCLHPLGKGHLPERGRHYYPTS